MGSWQSEFRFLIFLAGIFAGILAWTYKRVREQNPKEKTARLRLRQKRAVLLLIAFDQSSEEIAVFIKNLVGELTDKNIEIETNVYQAPSPVPKHHYDDTSTGRYWLRTRRPRAGFYRSLVGRT